MSREKSFAAWLRQQLDRREWSAAELARRTGVSPTSVSRWLNAREVPSSNHARRIADAFLIGQDQVLVRAGHRDMDAPLPPDDPRSRLIQKIKRVNLDAVREKTIDSILDIYLETDGESQESRLFQVA